MVVGRQGRDVRLCSAPCHYLTPFVRLRFLRVTTFTNICQVARSENVDFCNPLSGSAYRVLYGFVRFPTAQGESLALSTHRQ